MSQEIITKEENKEIVVKTESQQLMELIANLASDPNADVAKFSALLDLKERIISKQAEAEFNASYIRLAARLPRIKKDGKVEYPIEKNNPKAGMQKAFSYGKWEDIDKAIRPLLLSEGFTLSYTSMPRTSDGEITDLKRQVPFVLAPSVIINGRKKPELRYFADFTYIENGKLIVEDVKGLLTSSYKIKRHLMKAAGYDILET